MLNFQVGFSLLELYVVKNYVQQVLHPAKALLVYTALANFEYFFFSMDGMLAHSRTTEWLWQHYPRLEPRLTEKKTWLFHFGLFYTGKHSTVQHHPEPLISAWASCNTTNQRSHRKQNKTYLLKSDTGKL